MLKRLWHRMIGTPEVLRGRADYLEAEAGRVMWRAAADAGAQEGPWLSAREAAERRRAAVAMLAHADQLLAEARTYREEAEDLVGGR